MPERTPGRRWVPLPLGAVLDESKTPLSLGGERGGGFLTLQNYVYRRFGAVAKRTGTSPYGIVAGGTIGANPTRSGVRWYRGRPNAFKQLVVQSGDSLYTGNDSTGAMTLLANLTSGTTPAFYASVYDPAESGVGGTPASDVLVIAYGSGPPYKYDGTNFTQLSAAITNSFTGVVNFHEHLWFWGDVNNPDTVFATDLGNPEAYTFTQSVGGYSIGRGDGDPTVQNCVKLGDSLYIFKSNSIYVINGYDFAQGEYQFSQKPQITGYGIPSPNCVAQVGNTLIFWTGQNFYRIRIGSTEVEPIGMTIPYTCAKAANGSQTAIRAAGGDFFVQNVNGPQTYNNCAVFALDVGGVGYADTWAMYDDDASMFLQAPAWSIFKGIPAGCFIPFGKQGEKKALYFGDPQTGQVYQFGSHSTADVKASQTNGITTMLTTGLLDCQTPDIKKHLHNIYIDVLANAATFQVQTASDLASVTSQNQPTTSGNTGALIGTAVLGTTAILGGASPQTYQSPKATEAPSLDGNNFQITLQETSATSAYELYRLNLEIQEESYLW